MRCASLSCEPKQVVMRVCQRAGDPFYTAGRFSSIHQVSYLWGTGTQRKYAGCGSFGSCQARAWLSFDENSRWTAGVKAWLDPAEKEQLSHIKNPGNWRERIIPTINGCSRLWNSLHGSGSTFLISGFDSDSVLKGNHHDVPIWNGSRARLCESPGLQRHFHARALPSSGFHAEPGGSKGPHMAPTTSAGKAKLREPPVPVQLCVCV